MTTRVSASILAALLLPALVPSAWGLTSTGDPLLESPTPPPALTAPAPALYSMRNPDVRVEVFYEDFELGRIKADPALGPDVNLNDVQRRRGGVRVSFGDEQLSAYVSAFGESLKHPFLVTTFSNFGMSGGVLGEPVVGRLRRGGKVLLPYRVGVSFVGGWEEDAFVDYALFYGEFEGEFGVAVDYSGFRPSAGLYFTSLSGAVETDFGFARTTDDFYGFNGGAYAELKYDNKRSPVYGRIRGVVGDVEGVTVALGVKF